MRKRSKKSKKWYYKFITECLTVILLISVTGCGKNSTTTGQDKLPKIPIKIEDIAWSMNDEIIDGDRCSFWYHKALEHYRDHYFRYENGETVNYCGFRAKGTNIPFVPKSVDDDTYVAIIEGAPESLFGFSDDRSTFSADLEKVMKSQNLNNPVLVYYRIK